MTTYLILCRVWGGITGSREAYLKRNGELAIFASREEAQAEAARLNSKMNGPYAVASFHYSIEEQGA